MTIGWKLDRTQRSVLLDAFPPRYANLVADHVTIAVDGTKLPQSAINPVLIGHTDDGKGVEAMIVAINGSTSRPDGKVWHITWSLAEGRAARESNDIIAEYGWRELALLHLKLTPAHW
ncbi:hypothetical protein [Novosphingobium sp. CECT 9465]|uniref:hypothetical protein n=1 Tax=Novosphingobium sp. CECT 9465 TaxID=2829794 RepID=UPI001E57C06B|nr:hypothetical protein [Novosphingobium sp. CECT 9465]CAH0496800.1 hypothetical protein NVSP9465_01847 [Novosphingobium sp. CECT 9465]